jgi:hypothetical protein
VGIAEHVALADAFIATLPERKAPAGWSGRGIVTAAGGDMLVSLYVQVRSLRGHLGCTLPVQCFHLGPGELPGRWRELLEPLGVEFIDVRQISHPWAKADGFAIKPFAIYYSRFAEILWLDSDCVPARNPDEFFDWPEYREAGLVLWPDYPDRWTLRGDSWAAFGLPSPPEEALYHPGGEAVWQDRCRLWIDDTHLPAVPIESGEQLIDKRRLHGPLLLSMHYCNDHYDWYTRFQYGDKECLSQACRRLGIPFAVPRHYPSYTGHTCVQYDFAGEEAFHHRNNPHHKWRLGYNAVAGTSHGDHYHRYLHDAVNAAPTGAFWRVDRQAMSDLSGTFFYDADESVYGWLRLHADGRVEALSGEWGPTRWEVWQSPGDRILTILCGYGALTELRWHEAAGRWEGTHNGHERTPCKLVRETVPDGRMSRRRLVCGIPTLRRYDLLDDCLESLLGGRAVPDRVFVIDNGGRYAGRFVADPRVSVIRPDGNLGVARSWNLVAKLAPGADVLLLNDDVTFGPGTLERMLSADSAVVAAFHWSAFLQRREAWQAVGEYDEGYFPAYYEDLDYRRRLDRAGVRVAYVFDPECRHVGGGTGGFDREAYERNRHRYRHAWGMLNTKESA